MKRVYLALAMLVVLGSATLVHADVMDLREPSFPGANADEGDPTMTVNLPGTGALIVKASIATLSIYL